MFVTLKHKTLVVCSCMAGATAPVAPGAAPPRRDGGHIFSLDEPHTTIFESQRSR
jgi:hypothetical protein